MPCELFISLLFAQPADHYAPPIPPHTGALWFLFAMSLAMSVVGLLYGAFWLGMLIHCIRYEPDKFFWIWLMVIAAFPGAIVYAVVRYYPAADWTLPAWLRRFTRGKELARLQSAAESIGNAHQFTQWGDALRETGQIDRAAAAYEQALAKDAGSLPALWGAAQVAQLQQRSNEVGSRCRAILDRDPQYKFGDVSLAYGRAMLQMGRFEEGRQHLERHCQRWRHPEGVYLLAERCFADGDHAAARQHVVDMLRDLNSSPAAIARKHGRWKSRARRMLRQLPPKS